MIFIPVTFEWLSSPIYQKRKIVQKNETKYFKSVKQWNRARNKIDLYETPPNATKERYGSKRFPDNSSDSAPVINLPNRHNTMQNPFPSRAVYHFAVSFPFPQFAFDGPLFFRILIPDEWGPRRADPDPFEILIYPLSFVRSKKSRL